MTEREFQLGQRVQDEISGFTGIVTTIGDHLAGCTRYGVHPVGDGTDPERRGSREFFYPEQLEVVEGKDFTDQAENAITESEFELGNRVADRVTGFSGIVSVINFHLWNCPQISVRPSSDDNSEIVLEWFDEPQLTKLGEGIAGNFDDVQEIDDEASTGSISDARDRSLSR